MGEDNKVMNSHHPRWEEFRNLLNEALDYFELETDEPGCGWWCLEGTLGLYEAKKILEKMDNGDIDVPASISYYRQQGTRTDVEILLYVDDGNPAPMAPVTDEEIEAFEAEQLEAETKKFWAEEDEKHGL